jgi:methylated-DNA-protein-cysteine methyltransferase related protein
MSKSIFFQRIKTDVLVIVASIPKGKVCTFSSIGEHLDVVPRHIAFILSGLNDLEKIELPWWRVVGKDGNLGMTKRSETGEIQSELLRAEGFLVENNSIFSSFQNCYVACQSLQSGIPKQKRPTDTPKVRIKKVRLSSK